MENAASQQEERPEAHDRVPAARHAKTGSRYVPALDGLRAFAVLAVIAYHMGLGWAPGGLMGVTVFFVISGYLINGLLVAERDRTGRISLKGFWLRRVRRLFPAIALAVVGTAALCTLFDHELLDKMRPDIVPSLLFYNNWWQIFRDLSYFEVAGAPSPLTHFWSLSIEEQFYVAWPLLLLFMYKMRMPKRAIAVVVVALAVGSAAEMALMYDPHADPSRLYYGTDTRAFSLLLGVWLALAWPSAAFGDRAVVDKRDKLAWIALNVAGVLAFGGLVAIVVLTNGFSAFPYVGGTALASVLSALLVVVLVVPESWMARLFALRPLVWIGKRSYGMYLWHFPILLITTDANSTVGVPWWMRLVQLALVCGVSALSYTFVEDPIRKGKLGAWWRTRREGSAAGKLSPRGVVPAFCFAAMLAVGAVGVVGVQPTDYASVHAGAVADGRDAPGGSGSGGGLAGASDSDVGSGAAGSDASNSAPDGDRPEGASDEGGGTDGSSAASASGSSASSSGASDFGSIFGTQRFNAAGAPIYEPLLIGDSVSLGAEAEFYRVFPNGHLDSVVSRNIWESPYSQYRDAGQVGDYVVFCLGTNNAVEDWQIDQELLGDVDAGKRVFMVNTRNTQDWMQGTNDAIARTPERHANVTVLDWFGASAGHDEYFAGDGTHLTEEGARAYVALIRDAIEKSICS